MAQSCCGDSCSCLCTNSSVSTASAICQKSRSSSAVNLASIASKGTVICLAAFMYGAHILCQVTEQLKLAEVSLQQVLKTSTVPSPSMRRPVSVKSVL